MARGAEGLNVAEPRSLKPGGTIPRHTRRLFDKVLVAFHHACDNDDFQVAEALLNILEAMTTRHVPEDINRRRNMETLVAAHERLWHLRNPRAE